MLANNEFARFLVLFDRLAGEMNLWIDRTPANQLDWLPVDKSNVRRGARLSRVTIRNHYVHIAVAEHEAIRQI